jgi:2-phosphoglycerate kinase
MELNVDLITHEELNALTHEVLAESAGARYATNFRRWEAIRGLDVPMVVLIGGATGVGKSTIATRLAVRMNIVRVVATDAVREVMRATLTEGLMPTLYTSSFEAGSALVEPEPAGLTEDRVVLGFREQTAAVSVGVNALLERAATEGTNAIIEGVHIVPGFVDPAPFAARVLAIPVIVSVGREDVHRGHFAARARDDASSRPFERYVRGFDDIRQIQRYITDQARSQGVPVVDNDNLDRVLSELIDLVLDRATDRLSDARRAGARSMENHEMEEAHR